MTYLLAAELAVIAAAVVLTWRLKREGERSWARAQEIARLRRRLQERMAETEFQAAARRMAREIDGMREALRQIGVAANKVTAALAEAFPTTRGES